MPLNKQNQISVIDIEYDFEQLKKGMNPKHPEIYPAGRYHFTSTDQSYAMS